MNAQIWGKPEKTLRGFSEERRLFFEKMENKRKIEPFLSIPGLKPKFGQDFWAKTLSRRGTEGGGVCQELFEHKKTCGGYSRVLSIFAFPA